MKPIDKRIARIENAWRPQHRNKFTWEEFCLLLNLPKAFPDLDKMPKFLQYQHREFWAVFKPNEVGTADYYAKKPTSTPEASVSGIQKMHNLDSGVEPASRGKRREERVPKGKKP